MKGDEVEGSRGGRWEERHTLEVARRREGAKAENRRRREGKGRRLTAGEILSRRGYKNFIFRAITPRTTATVPENPLYPLKLIYIEILNDTHRPEQ